MKLTITLTLETQTLNVPGGLTREQIEERLEQNGDSMRFDEALEDLFGHFLIPAMVSDASVEITE